MKKLTYTFLMLLTSVIAFAQRAERSSREVANPESFESANINESGETLRPGMGGPGDPAVPIDNYQFLLLGLAVLLIAYFVWRSRQVQKA